MKAEHLGGDRYRVRRYIPDRGDGKPGQRSRTFHADNQRAANKRAASELDALDKAIATANARAGTLAGLVDRYETHKLDQAEWSPSTADRQAHILRIIREDIGHLRLDKLNAEHVDAWYAKLRARDLSAQTVKHYAVTLGAVLNQGQKWGKASTKPTANSTKPRVRNAQVRPPTAEVVQLLLTQATGSLRCALHVAAYAGLRRGEVVGLRWSDIDGAQLTVARSVLDRPNGGVFVKRPKSDRSRRMTIDAVLLAELEAQHARQVARLAGLGVAAPADWFMFPDLRKDATGQTPMRPGWLSLAWHRHRTKHGARSVNLHHLRHWNISTLLDMGTPMPVVQARAGHASISTTGIYAHALEAGDLATAGRLSAALGEQRVTDP